MLSILRPKKATKIQIKSRKYLFRRGLWYIVGFLLFYAPFAYFNKALMWMLHGDKGGDIHATCFRIPIANLFGGKGIDLLSVQGISLLLLMGSAFFVGAFFCARLCTAGAISEYVSRLVPDQFKIDWTKYVNPAPIRYGFLAGFILAPLTTGSLNCSYCTYGFLEKMMNGGLWRDIGVLSSTIILTAFLWLIIFGALTKGGRGYCNFMCPVGALQSLIHSVGARLPFTYKLKYAKEKCVSCQSCVKACPMKALKMGEEKITYSIHHCITCRQCTAVCPTNAITYGAGNRGWNQATIPMISKPCTETQKGV